MKKIIYIISLFVSSVLYTSCDALDLTPEDYFGSGNYWNNEAQVDGYMTCLLYTSPSPRDRQKSRMPSSA